MSDWLDDTPARGADTDQPAPVRLTPIGAVAARMAEVSPSWANVVTAPEQAPGADGRVLSLGRDRAHGVEAIREGWLLHRDASRVVDGASPDLALLMGDWCYAAGLCTITDHGTLDDVAQLARLVADVSARAGETAEELAPRWNDAVESMARG